jgi:hypothetical protein
MMWAAGGQEGEARTLILAAYGALDLFGGTLDDLLAWSARLRSDRPTRELLPTNFTRDNQMVLLGHLSAAGVVDEDNQIDPYRLQGFRRIIELLPFVRAQELARRPTPGAQIVFTVPPAVTLPPGAEHLQRSLAARVYQSLASADQRVLLASPFWSDQGRDNLLPALQRPIALHLPITLAGATSDPSNGHHQAMLRFADALHSLGAEPSVLTYRPPRPGSLFHAKLVAGARGYLGSANLTASGLGEHVEAGMPMTAADVEQAWWLIDVLRLAGMLVPAHRSSIGTDAAASP